MLDPPADPTEVAAICASLPDDSLGRMIGELFRARGATPTGLEAARAFVMWRRAGAYRSWVLPLPLETARDVLAHAVLLGGEIEAEDRIHFTLVPGVEPDLAAKLERRAGYALEWLSAGGDHDLIYDYRLDPSERQGGACVLQPVTSGTKIRVETLVRWRASGDLIGTAWHALLGGSLAGSGLPGHLERRKEDIARYLTRAALLGARGAAPALARAAALRAVLEGVLRDPEAALAELAMDPARFPMEEDHWARRTPVVGSLVTLLSRVANGLPAAFRKRS